MNLQAIRKMARSMTVKTSRKNKADLVRAIQTAEGNFPCFGTAINGACDQQDCLWRQDCLRNH